MTVNHTFWPIVEKMNKNETKRGNSRAGGLGV